MLDRAALWLLFAGALGAAHASSTPVDAFAADASTWNMTEFLPHEFDPGCRPPYLNGYRKVNFRKVWFEEPTREHAFLLYQRCARTKQFRTKINTTIRVHQIESFNEEGFHASVTIDMNWVDENATRIPPALLWQPQVRFPRATATLDSAAKRVDLFPSVDGSQSMQSPHVWLSQTFHLNVEARRWSFQKFPFDEKSFVIELAVTSRNAILEEVSISPGRPHKGESFRGLKCSETWGNASLEWNDPVNSGEEQLTESRVQISLEANREAHTVVGGFVLPVLAALVLGWSGFMFGLSAPTSSAVLLSLSFTVVVIHIRWSTKMTPLAYSWSWLDMLLIVQAISIAVSTAVFASCYYMRIAWGYGRTVTAIVTSFQLFFPVHAMLGSFVIASLLNLWESEWRYVLAFLWVFVALLLQAAHVRYLCRQSNEAEDYPCDTDSNPVSMGIGDKAGVESPPNVNLWNNRNDFPTM